LSVFQSAIQAGFSMDSGAFSSVMKLQLGSRHRYIWCFASSMYTVV